MNQYRSPNGTVRRRLSTKKSRKAAGSTNKRTESMKSVSELSISSNGSFMKDGTRIQPNYRDIPLKEIMRYYTPKWMAVVGIFASVCSSFQLPMFGFILSQYVFVFSINIDTEEGLAHYQEERDKWSLAFLGLVIGIGLSSFI